MIIELRNALQTYAVKIFLWVVLIFLAVFFSPALFRLGGGSEQALITINKDAIDIPMLEQRTALLANTESPKITALHLLVQETLLDQVARQLGIQLGADYIEEKLRDPYFIISYLLGIVPWELVTQYGINTTALPQVLRHYHMSVQSFERAIEQAVQRALVQEMLNAAIYVPEAQLKDQYVRVYSKRTYTVTYVPFTQVLAEQEQQPISQEALERYYRKEKKRYILPEQRVLQGWSMPRSAFQLPIADAQIEQYYSTQKAKKYVDQPAQIQVRHIAVNIPEHASEELVETTRKKAQEIHERVTKSPEQFASIAQELSADETTKKKGGLMGWFKRGDLKDEAFEQAAFRLKQDNDISEVIKTQKGFALIQRVARKPISYKPLDTVKKEIHALLQQQAFAKQVAQDMSKLIHQDEKSASALEQYAQMHKAVPFSKTVRKGDPGVLAERAFRISQGNWAFTLEGDHAIVFGVQSITAPSVPELPVIQATVKKDMLAQTAKDTLQELMEQMVAQKDATMAKKYKSTSKVVGPLSADEQTSWERLAQEQMPVEKMLRLDTAGQRTYGVDEQGNGYLVVLDTIEPFDTQKFEAVRSTVSNELYKQNQAIVRRSFVASLYRNGTIQSKESLLTAIQ